MNYNPFNNKVGLALGGGAAKGIAHIGVLKALEERDIPIHCLAGTSVGALIAAYHAFGKSADEIMEVGKELSFGKIANFTLKKRGMFTTEAIEEMILRDLGAVRIEDAHKPLAIVATDITTGEKVVFRKGDLAQAVCATVAVPGAYVPVEYKGRLLVDGGLVENVPITELEKMGAGIKVAVDLNGVKKYPYPKDILGVMGNAFDIAIDLRTRDQLKAADVVVSLDLGRFSRLSNKPEEVQALYNTGYASMEARMNKILRRRSSYYLYYIINMVKELAPIKIPRLIKSYKEKISQIEFK